MRILVASASLPFRGAASGGERVRSAGLSWVAARHRVTLATLARADEEEREAVRRLRAQGVEVHPVWRAAPGRVRRWMRRGRLAGRWLRGRDPLRTLAFAEPEMQRLLARLLREEPFDLLQVEDNAMGGYRYPTSVPSVLLELDALWEGGVGTERRGGVVGALGRAERARWARFRPDVWRRFDRIQVFTERDAAAIRALAPDVEERVRVNPFGFDLPAGADPAREQAELLVFTGDFRHAPNVDAGLWLVRDILPRVRALHPGARLLLVGGDPPAAIRSLAGEGVAVTGRVPAVEPFLERAAVVVAPMRTGGGMRVKVLHAMAAGRPVVTTALGAAGLDAGEEALPLLLAEDAGAFAAAVARQLGDEAARGDLGRRARAFVAARHRWDSYGARLEAVYDEICGTTRPSEAGACR
jgi:glycosyltransferase involved in cell wall biosynthesis